MHDQTHYNPWCCAEDASEPRLAPGQALLVAVCGNEAANLWSFGSPNANIELGDLARLAWGRALNATLNCIPYLWRTPEFLKKIELRCARIGDPYIRSQAVVCPGRPIGAVDGLSFGLSFVLSQVSLLTNIPIPVEFAATAEVSPDGEVIGVDMVSLKAEAIIRLAPCVKILLVAQHNRDEALEAAYKTSLAIKAVSTAQEAIECVFGTRIRDELVRTSQNPVWQTRITEDLFEMTLFHSKTVFRWKPVVEAIKIIEKASGQVLEDFRLKFARAVAGRHESNEPITIPIPSDEILRTWPAPLRVRLVAHLVQHCADTGTIPVEVAERMAYNHLVRGSEAFHDHLRLLGALGRLLAITGRKEEALELELEAAKGFIERLNREEVSWPLSMAMRLAGTLRNKEAFELAVRMWNDAGRDRYDPISDRFLRLAWASGMVMMGIINHEVIATLEGLVSDPGREFLRWSAMRYLIRALLLDGKRAKAMRLREQLSTEAVKSEASEFTRIAWSLVRLEERPDDRDAWKELRDLDPGVCGHIEEIARRDGKPPGMVAVTDYPY